MKTSLEDTYNNIKQLFYIKREWTKNEIASETHYSLGTITNCLKRLVNENIIIYSKDALSTGGRKSKIYCLNKNFATLGYVLLKKNKDKYYINVYKVNLFNEILNENTFNINGELDEVISVINSIDVNLLIISIPGIVYDNYIEVCDYSCLENIYLKDYINTSFIIENDVNIGVIGLSYFYPNIKNMALLYQPFNDFVGCGILINHKLYNGSSHKAGELRYLPILDENKQSEMLLNDPKGLLNIHINVLKAVLDVELIGVTSDVYKIKGTDEGVTLVDLDKCQIEGLYKIGMKNLGGIDDEKLY